MDIEEKKVLQKYPDPQLYVWWYTWSIMALILDGHSDSDAHGGKNNMSFRREKNPICDCSLSNQMP